MPQAGAPDSDRADDVQRKLNIARLLEQTGDFANAEAVYRELLAHTPQRPEASMGLVRGHLRRGRISDAVSELRRAVAVNADSEALSIDLAVLLADTGHDTDAIALLEQALAQAPQRATSWLLLGRLRNARGESTAALTAWFQALTRATRAGQWIDERTTPAELADPIHEALTQVRARRGELFRSTFAGLVREHGASALARVEATVSNYLGEIAVSPPSARQRPTFMYVPGLPQGPFHDPSLVSWSSRLLQSYADIRREAIQAAMEAPLVDFVNVPAGRTMADYVGGDGPAPAWEALFFFRRGQRFDDNHRRCPITSEVLDSSDLCRIADQAPEILFSVLRAGSLIKRHYGVTNARLVLHLPLIVPGDCALNLVDHGTHAWREGELFLFDDTYLHEAWNRAGQDRIILLMDCWNPHLTPVEREALRRLIETISGLSDINQALQGKQPGVAEKG